jgi:adenylosuccinate lyase
MRDHIEDIDFEHAARLEKSTRHDVMAHVQCFAELCPTAAPIIHLGATSSFVTDNTDLLLFKKSFELIQNRLSQAIFALADFAETHQRTACLGLTHLQPAQPTTIGKRACLWIQDLLDDLRTIEFRAGALRARGAKGTTGTQASFLKLFDGDHARVVRLDQLIAEKLGFKASYPITGQTYSRKIDCHVLDALSGIAQSAHKLATDIRILASRKELDEPFETSQIGSSAMAYKRNPMRCERICSLARFVISLQSSTANTLATQWMERTLDDSANRRIVLPQAFLAVDAILMLLFNVASGLVVYPKMLEKNLREELPFLATENILMAAVAAGGDRQLLHERIRAHSQTAAQKVKLEGGENDLLMRLTSDESFSRVNFDRLLEPQAYVGRAPEQVAEFLTQYVEPLRKHYSAAELATEIRV